MTFEQKSLSSILDKLFEKDKAPSTNVNLTDRYNNLQMVLSDHTLLFLFTTSSTVTIRNQSLHEFIRLLEWIEKPILTRNSYKPLTNKKLAAIVSNTGNNVDTELHTIYANFQLHHRQYWRDCHDYYCKYYGSSYQIKGRYIRLKDTICSLYRYKGHIYLSCDWIWPVL